MKLVPVERTELKKRYFKPTKLYAVFMEFASSDHTAVRVDDHGYKRATAAASAFKNSAKRFNVPHIKAITRNGNLYLIKEFK